MILYALAYALPAAFTRTITGSSGETAMRITAWGWQAALYSVLPFLIWFQHPIAEPEMGLLGLAFGGSNLGFIAAAILLPLRRRRAALVCTMLAVASMIYGGIAVPPQASELIGGPAGHLGPGYYAWLAAGVLMAWTAFSSRSAA